MTIKARILEALEAEYPNGLTHNQLATRLDIPEPSIRRAMQQLRNHHEVIFYKYADSSATDMVFVAWR